MSIVKSHVSDHLAPARSENSFLLQVWLIAQQELKVSFASKRGLFVTGVFVFIWALLLFYPIRFSAQAMQNSDTASLMLSLLSLVGLEPLKNWPLSEFALYWVVALFLLPAFSILMAVDQMITERSRGGLRFLILRCSRSQLLMGRFFGHLLIQLSLLFITLLITYLLSLYNNPEHWLDALALVPVIFINLLAIICPFIALMSLLSVLMKSVKMALLVCFISILLGGFMINYLAASLPFISVLNYWIPGIQLVSMAKLLPSVALYEIWIPLMQTASFLCLAQILFHRQEI